MTIEETYDVIIVGAGISGINCAYRVQGNLPGISYAIIESRDAIGGTWDFFKYPGVRSDSEVFTFGFEWHTWENTKPIRSGPEIQEYMIDAATRHGIDKHIQFRHRVLSADWSSKRKEWDLAVDHEGQSKRYHARWVVLGTGYYDYTTPLQTTIPGLDNFNGQIVHPQFWPSNFDYNNKKIAIIGSGATTISLFPALAERAGQVTMIQRSPTYVIASKNVPWTPRFVPKAFLNTVRRMYHMCTGHIIVWLCRHYPDKMRERLRQGTLKWLPRGIAHDPHFKPRYNPWQQRMCLDPDASFYKSLRQPNTGIVTGVIDTVTKDGVQMKDGTTVDAEVIVTATGLQMLMGGGIELSVDGEPVTFVKRFVWNGSMLDGIPNLMTMIGYTNSSWTLAADDSAIILTRLWKDMERRGHQSATPRASMKSRMEPRRYWQLISTYVDKAEDQLPVYGNLGNWKPRTEPPIDYFWARLGNCTSDLEFA